MAEFLQQCGSWGVLATLAAYAAGVWVNRKTGKALFNPLLMGSIFVIVFLSCFGVPYADYKSSAQPISWLLMPATVSLAIPLYEKWELLEKNLAAIFAAIAAGVLTSLGSVLAMAWVLRIERTHAVSFLPKSVTTAIGMDVAETLGGAAALAGACLGFLPCNINPAKMFMGDTGAMFIGYTLGCLTVMDMFRASDVITFAVPFLVLGLPIFDMAFAAIRRILSGRSPFSGDKMHLHHKLVAIGLTQRKAVAVLYSVSAILGIVAVMLTGEGFKKAIFIIGLVFVVVAVGCLLMLRSGTKQEEIITKEKQEIVKEKQEKEE